MAAKVDGCVTMVTDKQHQHHHHHRKDRQSGDRKDFHIKAFKTPKETLTAVCIAGARKASLRIDLMIILGLLAGLYVGVATIFAQIVSNGSPNADIGLRKLLNGLTFPIGIVFIIIAGGELFTGNCMMLPLALIDRQITWRGLLYNWFFSYVTNYMGAGLAVYLFGYLTDLFIAEPWHTPLLAVTETKVQLGWGVALLRAIPANMLVCLALFIAASAEDVIGKIVGSWLPILCFATIGYEHCVANMAITSLSLMYGANTNLGEVLWRNQLPSLLGNIIGGGFVVGALHYWIYGFPTLVPLEEPAKDLELGNADGKMPEYNAQPSKPKPRLLTYATRFFEKITPK